MRILALLPLVLAIALPASAQQLAPGGYHAPSAGAGSVLSSAVPRPDSLPSLRRHILVGTAVGVLATGAGFLIEGAVNDDAYDECMMCAITIPITIAAGGVVGGILGAGVYGVRRFSKRARAGVPGREARNP